MGMQVVSQCGMEWRQSFEEHGCSVVCQFCPDHSTGRFSDAMVATHVSDETFALFMCARRQVAERRICVEQEERFQQRLAMMREQLASAAAMDQELSRHRVQIAELLTLKCPRCHQAFFDFEGCFALKCASCGCGFCAWCLADCGHDAHAHVLLCDASNRQGRHHGSWDDFIMVQRSRRRAAVAAYMDPLRAAMRDRVLNACAQDFADLDLDIQ